MTVILLCYSSSEIDRLSFIPGLKILGQRSQTSKYWIKKLKYTFMTAFSIKKMTKGFTSPQILPIVEKPCYESIAKLQLKLNVNTAFMQLNFRCSQFDHLWLTARKPANNTISAIPFLPPHNPGATPIVPAASTSAQISSIQYNFSQDTLVFKKFSMVDKALKQMLIVSVNKIFIKSL